MTPPQLLAERPRLKVLPQPVRDKLPTLRAPDPTAAAALPDDLAREVYCILGIPIDAIDMAEALRRIKSAAAAGVPYLVSTPNLNFLINSRTNPEFRESLLQSDLCPADGMPLIWIARMLGLPIRERVAGSDMFESLRAARDALLPLKVFLFGGPEGIAAAAAHALNASPCGLNCVGTMFPGYGPSAAMSTDEIIGSINESGADFLMVGLSAAKGQAWLRHNHRRLRIPVRAQLGAVINFEAGTVARAPRALRRLGLEWLWRIKEEPHLWRRYARDGALLLRLLATRVLPLAAAAQWRRLRVGPSGQSLEIDRVQHADAVVLRLSGSATAPHVATAIAWFRDAIAAGRPIILNFSEVCHIDARFLGLLLMLRKQANDLGTDLKLTGIPASVARSLRLNDMDTVLSSDRSG
jgi:N-acetylglucosaminyldiphosphoundecaprenol N-acetyl-beta-D-mannosaminyltransferase